MGNLILELIGVLYMHWINSVTYFDSFDVEYISKEIKTIIGNKNI